MGWLFAFIMLGIATVVTGGIALIAILPGAVIAVVIFAIAAWIKGIVKPKEGE